MRRFFVAFYIVLLGPLVAALAVVWPFTERLEPIVVLTSVFQIALYVASIRYRRKAEFGSFGEGVATIINLFSPVIIVFYLVLSAAWLFG